MTFTHLGRAIEKSAELAHRGITKVHHVTDSTLDKTGLSAFIPPAIHEVSDAALGLTQRGILDLGQTAGAVLRSFDNQPLHVHDKSIGGNLRQPKKKGGSKKEAKKSNKKSGEEIPKVKLCKNCHELPRAGDFKYCSTKCAKEAEESDSDHD